MASTLLYTSIVLKGVCKTNDYVLDLDSVLSYHCTNTNMVPAQLSFLVSSLQFSLIT